MQINDLVFEISLTSDGKPKMMITGKVPGDEEKNKIRYISFFMYESDLKEFANNHFDFTLNDLRHRMNICGETITFYDLEIPYNKMSGEFTVPFIKFVIPWFVRKIIMRCAKRIWNGLKANFPANKYDFPQVNLKFTQEQVSRWVGKYGQASGYVNIDVQEQIIGKFEADKKNKQFCEMFNRLQTIARNSTFASFQRATLKLYGDSRDYYWLALTPHNKTIMNGGLILHGKETENPEWSIHT